MDPTPSTATIAKIRALNSELQPLLCQLNVLQLETVSNMAKFFACQNMFLYNLQTSSKLTQLELTSLKHQVQARNLQAVQFRRQISELQHELKLKSEELEKTNRESKRSLLHDLIRKKCEDMN